MKIAVIGPVPPIRGGIAQHTAQLVESLRRAGHTVDVISWASQYPGFLYRGEQTGDTAAAPSGTRFSLRWWNPFSWWSAGHRARHADLLVFPWVHPVHAIPLRTCRVAAGKVRDAVIVHNLVPHERHRFDRGLARFALHGVDAAIVHTETMAAQVAALLPQTRVVVAAIPPLLDVTLAPLPPRPPTRLLFLGFVRHYKGLDVLLDAICRLPKGSVTLTVAGDFWDEGPEHWTEVISAAGLTDVVELRPGYVPDGDVSMLLASHHLLVLPYRDATQSGAVPIAYAAGRAVVASSVSGLREQVRDGENGVLVEPDDPTALADGIQRATADLDKLSAAALVSAPSWDELARAVTSDAPGVAA